MSETTTVLSIKLYEAATGESKTINVANPVDEADFKLADVSAFINAYNAVYSSNFDAQKVTYVTTIKTQKWPQI